MHDALLHMQLLSLLRYGEWHDLRVRRHVSASGFESYAESASSLVLASPALLG